MPFPSVNPRATLPRFSAIQRARFLAQRLEEVLASGILAV